MGCISGIVRTVMFIFNIACLIVGLVVLALGSFVYASMKNFADSYSAIPIALIVVGVFVFLVSFLGCCGALRSNKCMLLTYAIVLLILLVVQLAGGIYGIVLVNGKYDEFKGDVNKELVKVLQEYNSNDAATTTIDSLQLLYKCCGINGKEDYLGIVIQQSIPSSCCGKDKTQTCLANEIYDTGCGNKFFDVIAKYMNTLSIVVICICGVELIGSLLAIYLSRKK